MKVILTGATGAAGLGVLRRAMADPSISKITVLSRRPLPEHLPKSDKITRIEHSDFSTYSPEFVARLEGHGACIWGLGKSSTGMSEEEYTRVTYEYPIAALKAFIGAGIQGEDGKFRFIYVSGSGANTNEKGILFARVKGRTEKDLASLAAESASLQVYNIRPGYFFPSDPQDAAASRKLSLRVADKIFGPVFRTFISSQYIDYEDLGRFMLEVGKGRVEAGTFSNADMLRLLQKWDGGQGGSQSR